MDTQITSPSGALAQPISTGFRSLTLNPPGGMASAAAIIYLHGVGECGQDMRLLTRYGLPAAVADGRATANCPIYCPQLPAGAAWRPDQVTAFVQQVRQRHGAVALMGYSLGASGVCATVAAAGPVAEVCIAIAGQAPHTPQVSPGHLQFLAIEGALDTWPDTLPFVQSLQRRGGQATHVSLPGLGHYISEEAVAHATCTDLLRSLGIEICWQPH